MLLNEFRAAVKRNPATEDMINRMAMGAGLEIALAHALAYEAAEQFYMSRDFDTVLDQYTPARLAELSGGGCAGRHFVLAQEIAVNQSVRTDFSTYFSGAIYRHYRDEAERNAAKANMYRFKNPAVIVSLASS